MPYGKYVKRLRIIQFKALTPNTIAGLEKRPAANEARQAQLAQRETEIADLQKQHR